MRFDISLTAPIIMLPLAGCLFLLGIVLSQAAGAAAVEFKSDGGFGAWAVCSLLSTACHLGCFYIVVAAT